MPQQKRERLLDILHQIEGVLVADILLENPPPLPPEPKVSPKKGSLKIQFISLPHVKLPFDPKKDNRTVLKFSTGEVLDGPVVDAKKWKLDAKEISLAEEEKLHKEMVDFLMREVGKKGDLAVCELGYFAPSARLIWLGPGTLETWAEKDLSEFVRRKVSGSDDAVNPFVDVCLVETADKKYALFQFVGSGGPKDDDTSLLALVYQPNGTARFDIGQFPTPVEIMDRRPLASDEEIMGYLLYQEKQRIYASQLAEKALKSLNDILNGKIEGATLEQKRQALRLLGETKRFETADLMIRYLQTEFPSDGKESQHPAVWALIQIQPRARPALLEAIGKAKDEKEKKVLIDALVAVEGKPAAEKLLEGIGKK